ncbi:MAG: D-alanine--D-alanine ligase family protein [Actinomycetes bacterium]
MADLGRVVVLAGGFSHEREVSQRSGRRVADALIDIGVEAEVRDVDASLLPSLRASRPDAVFPLLHGSAGEDGSLRDVLEVLDLPYVGARPDACRRAFAKPVAKGTLRASGVATPAGVALPHEMFRELGAATLLDAIVAKFGLPLFVKPTEGGSSLGAAVVRDAAELPSAMVRCFAYGSTALVEQFVEGTEVAVSVVDTGDGPRALPPVEVVADDHVYDYAARYTAGRTEFFCPARLDEAVTATVERTALVAHERLGLRDLSRTDLIVDREGLPWFLEVNVAPGMTETSLLPQSVTATGMDLGVVCRDLLQAAAARGSART